MDDGDGLENRFRESERGFESHPLRHLEDILPMMREAFRMTKVELESKVI